MHRNDIQELRDTITAMWSCKSQHVASVPVCDMFGDTVAWEGVVEVFDLDGHAQAKRAYGWQFKTDNEERKAMVVLELPPVDSAESAVRVAIAAKARQK